MMLRNKTIMGAILISTAVLMLAGCYKDKTIVFDTGAEITRPVSFAGDIIPIFNKSCNGSGCHSSGGIAPDLTAANAYISLQKGNYLNTQAPASNELFLWMTGKKGMPMPTSGPIKDDNALVLAWIKQGAQNN